MPNFMLLSQSAQSHGQFNEFPLLLAEAIFKMAAVAVRARIHFPFTSRSLSYVLTCLHAKFHASISKCAITWAIQRISITVGGGHFQNGCRCREGPNSLSLHIQITLQCADLSLCQVSCFFHKVHNSSP